MGMLRSSEWYAGDDRNRHLHRAWMRRGVPPRAFRRRPHIAIANTPRPTSTLSSLSAGISTRSKP
jgi:hypothetical protein